MEFVNAKELENYIKKCIIFYYKGEPLINDSEYDDLIEKLEQLNPNSPILNKMEINTDDWNFPKEVLPYKLFSIKKIKSIKDIKNWIQFISKKISGSTNGLVDFKVCITGKYDGQKILGYRNNYYTRGEEGIEAFNVSSRINKCKLQSISYNQEGELICSRKNFEKYFQDIYTSPRNLVPSIFSNETPIENLDKFDWLCYSIYNSNLDKSKQIEICNQTNTYKIPYVIRNISELTEDMLFDYFQEFSKDYICDGLVIDVEEAIYRNQLGYTAKYLDCCRAYKADNLNQDIQQSEILNIVYQESRYGKMAPVATISPVTIHNGEVTNVSLYNAKFILENKIFIGQKVLVERRGAINPKIYDTLTHDDIKVTLPKICPYCGNILKWDDNKVDLYCENEFCKEKITQKIYFFLKTIGVKDFGLKSVRNIIFNTNLSSIEDFLNQDKIQNINVEGIGQITKNQYFDKLDKIKEEGIKLEVLQEASGCFEGIGKNTFKILNTVSVDMEYYYKDSYYNSILDRLVKLKDIGEITAESYLYGLPLFYNFLDKIKKYIKISDNKKEQSIDLSNFSVVFTGFRNDELKNYIEQNGGKVLSTISSNCNYLVQKDENSSSSKTKKAKELGIKVLSLEKFKELLNYN